MSEKCPKIKAKVSFLLGTISPKIVFYTLLCLFLFLLLPLFVISAYNYPCADDFNNSVYLYHLWQSTHSFPLILKATWDITVAFYRTWQGSFTAGFLMVLQPAVFGESMYSVTAFIMLAMFCSGTVFFCRTLLGWILGVDKWTVGILTLTVLLWSVQAMPSPVEGLFWYCGSMYYTFFHGLFLFQLGAAMRASTTASCRGKIAWTVLSSIFSFLVGGGNYVTALIACLVLAFMAVVLFLRRHKNRFWPCIPLLFCLCALILSVAAPGNSVRMDMYNESPSLLPAILQSFWHSWSAAIRWFDFPFIASMLILFPYLWHGAGQAEFRFPMPWLVTLGSYCLFSAAFSPSLYALKYPGDDRVFNVYFYCFILLAVGNLFYWCGWLSRATPKMTSRAEGLFQKYTGAGQVAAAVLFLVLTVSSGVWKTYTSPVAAASILIGEAAAYGAEMQDRIAIYHDPDIRDVRVDPFSNRPKSLYFSDITEDPGEWRNSGVRAYYQKDSVVLLPPPQ